ncbi:hypothetical protein BHM03_00033050 [Ensete ventricosum]|nr:hypothetical protein BHM03_00033050 [Ensete ventricosum]
MLSLRFPNSCIKAKVFVQKIGFKLHVIRLNRVESFYALLLHFYNKRSEKTGQSTMARPLTGAVGHGLATCKGAPTARGHGRLQRADYGQPTRGDPNDSGAYRKGDCRQARQPPPAQG